MVTDTSKSAKNKIHPLPEEEEVGGVNPMMPPRGPSKSFTVQDGHQDRQDRQDREGPPPSVEMGTANHLEQPRLQPVKLEPLPRPRNLIQLPELEAEARAKAARLAANAAEAAQSAVREAARLQAEAEAAENMVVQRDENAEEL